VKYSEAWLWQDCPLPDHNSRSGEYVLDADSHVQHKKTSVVFYFFDQRRGKANGPADAIRAMLSQLVQLHRNDKKTVDIASVILAKNAIGEFTATDNEVYVVLRMLLDHLTFTFLVFDGVDECSNHDELFKRIEDAASGSQSCALLLLGRPTVQLPGNCTGIHSRSISHIRKISGTLKTFWNRRFKG
jgi:hypothetical protein